MKPIRLVVLGGSGIATPELVRALVERRAVGEPRESGIALDIVLVGRNEAKLGIVAGASALEASRGRAIRVHHTTDIEGAIEGADLVLNQVRVGGMGARAFDETYPRDLGLPGEEIVGAGGFANASRTIPVVLEYARLIERICPNALMLSFSNPASMVQYAINRYTKVKVIGLCDAPISLRHEIADAVGLPERSIRMDYVGMHHFGWVTDVWHQGKSLLNKLLADPSGAAPHVSPELVRSIGALPGHYFNYHLHPDRMLAQQAGKPSRGSQLEVLQDEILEDMAQALERHERSSLLAQRHAAWYAAIIAPVIAALIDVEQEPGRYILNMRNGNTLPWLPEEAIIEVPALIDAGRITPLAIGPVPLAVRTLIQSNCTYEMLAVEAIVAHDEHAAAQALLFNAMIASYDQARAIVDRAWSKGVAL